MPGRLLGTLRNGKWNCGPGGTFVPALRRCAITRPFFFFDFFDLALPALQPALTSARFAALSVFPTSLGTTHAAVAAGAGVLIVCGAPPVFAGSCLPDQQTN